MKTLKLIWVFAIVIISFSGFTQCPTGEVSVELTVSTDQYGSEGYWEIVPTGNSCGNGTIASGGNAAVGCNGAGAQNQPSGGYGGNLHITEGPWCLPVGNEYDLIYVDDYADGGFEFEITVNGYMVNSFDAITGGFLRFHFTAEEPPIRDVSLYSISSPNVYEDLGNKSVKGVFFNYGSAVVNSLDVNYQIDNDPVQTMSLTGLNIQNFETGSFDHSSLWNATLGNHSLKIWASNINGGSDLNPSNDTLFRDIEIGAGIPNIIDYYLTSEIHFQEVVNSSDLVSKPTDLDFHPVLSKNQLWVVNKRTEQVGGSTITIDNPAETNQTNIHKVDGNAWHFMSLPTGIAFSSNGNFATSLGVFDANHNGGAPFTGPSLWSSDLSIYAEPSGGNGSHLDMLHVSPNAQGIASENENVFWVFDGYNNDIVRYDFVDDHGPGASFHGDAKILRYSDFTVAKDPNEKVVSHLVLKDNWVYVVDYGNKKVFRLDKNTGNLGGTPTFGPFESVVQYRYMTGYTTEDVVNTGLIEPAGIDIVGDRMIISDYSSGDIIIYDISTIPAIELGKINTSAQGIMGVKIGPDGRIWYVDYDANTVSVINIGALNISDVAKQNVLKVFPNPAKGQFTIVNPSDSQESVNINIYGATGNLVYSSKFSDSRIHIQTTNWAKGIYKVIVHSEDQIISNSLIVQ